MQLQNLYSQKDHRVSPQPVTEAITENAKENSNIHNIPIKGTIVS